MIKRLAIIPAKKISKRIKNKNLKLFKGKPLLYYPIKAAKQSKIFDTIHISSDSEKILNYSNSLNIKTDFKRPKKLSKANVGLFEVMNYVIKEYKKKNLVFDQVWLLFTTNPFITKKNIIDCKKIFEKISFDKRNCLMTVTKYNYPVEWALKKNKSGNLISLQKKRIGIYSQKLKKIYCEAGMINIYSTKNLLDNLEKRYFPYEVSLYNSVDIDTLEDLELAKKLFR
tara:strand:- start:4041 stop:4721 length:681 start_codon:yes stop_codon:yes gene_type:complete